MFWSLTLQRYFIYMVYVRGLWLLWKSLYCLPCHKDKQNLVGISQ